MTRLPLALVALALTASGCHPGPIIDTGPQPAAVGGTIAGMVSTGANTAVVDRKVTAVNTETGAQFTALTGVNGGYTIKVPQGHYRLEIELRAGETVAKHPGDTQVNKSDLDPKRNFIIAGG